MQNIISKASNEVIVSYDGIKKFDKKISKFKNYKISFYNKIKRNYLVI